jgi:methionine biosynthesis protein MetW
VLTANARGVPVIELDIDRQLAEFADGSYDVVVMSQTLQATHRPAEVLRQIARIGRSVVVSVPNFGLWRHRVSLLRGRMPVSRDLPHRWHETPNIHLSTLTDLEALFADSALVPSRRVLLDEDGQPLRGDRWGNLRAAGAVYVLTPPG